ncbi:hypothetical protein AB833_27980 [Chromatiales bacterium (ex Bugula neritina AB1)]|nr:hypothetical protein AB833_27980 [Chromatiales bacterium (ex Bugula neritina AB1)]
MNQFISRVVFAGFYITVVAVITFVTPVHAAQAQFSGCTIDQRQTLQTAVDAAQVTVELIEKQFAALPAPYRARSPRYSRWFGDFRPDRFDKVAEVFTRINTVLRTNTIHFDCACTDRYYARARVAEPYTIRICSLFWNLSLSGRDFSHIGTIIHELTHFADISGAHDLVYGTKLSRQLAINKPGKAVINADNYEYFATNSDNLAFSGDGRILPIGKFEPLKFNAPRSARLPEGGMHLYSVQNFPDRSGTVVVTSSAGDVDLYTYPSADAASLLCESSTSNVEDQCELKQNHTFVEVRAYEASDYTIEVRLF